MSLMNWEDEQRVKRKIAEGWHVNDKGYLVRPKPSSTLKQMDNKNKDFKGRIAEAEVKNRMLLPPEAQPQPIEEKEDEEKEDFSDTVKLATEEDIKSIKKKLIRNQVEILSKLENIEDLLKKKLGRD